MGTDSGFAPLIVTEPSIANGLGGMGLPHDDRPHARHVMRGGKARARPNAGSRSALGPAHSHLLPSDDFACAVHHETRRSERSNAPLSIVQYAIDDAFVDDPLYFERLFAALQNSMRETDVLGQIGVDTLAILCPDTDNEGARGLVAKMAPLIASLPVAVVTATYPERLFDNLSRGASAGAEFHSFVVPSGSTKNVGTYPLKGALDVIAALIALIVLGPLMLLVALIVKATSEGPVIFKQQRIGKGGMPFTFYKFRSMVVNTDDRIHREYTANLIRAGRAGAAAEPATGSFKMKADPRVTKIGRIIRKTSLDELPQLFNVLKGDMSMVGPRPCIPYEAANYEPWHLRRILSAKPGITGVWQVEGRSKVNFSEMVRMDLRYIRDCTLMLDLKIMMKTFGVVIRCDGAS